VNRKEKGRKIELGFEGDTGLVGVLTCTCEISAIDMDQMAMIVQSQNRPSLPAGEGDSQHRRRFAGLRPVGVSAFVQYIIQCKIVIN